jgi:hypothetical protein
MRTQPNVIEDFMNHLGTSAIMELLLKSISCEQEGDGILEVRFFDPRVQVYVRAIPPVQTRLTLAIYSFLFV